EEDELDVGCRPGREQVLALSQQREVPDGVAGADLAQRLTAFARLQLQGALADEEEGIGRLAGAEGERAAAHWTLLARGGQDALAADYRRIEDDGSDADQAQVLDGAGVQHHPVADGDSRADPRADAPVGDVDDREVLDVGFLADLDALFLAADHASVPDAGAIADHHVSRDGGPAGDEDVAPETGGVAVDRPDH